MAPRDQLSVVDEKLNVYGVTGLKVADLSIVPQNVAANTNNTAHMIGEKCAAMILADLGLKDGIIPAQSESKNVDRGWSPSIVSFYNDIVVLHSGVVKDSQISSICCHIYLLLTAHPSRLYLPSQPRTYIKCERGLSSRNRPQCAGVK